MNTQPIGFLDSGLGGITVLDEAVRELPGEHFLYYGDTRNAPYGDKSAEEVIRLVDEAVTRLLEQDCKAIVLACNTATTAAAEFLRRQYDFPIIGIEPALKPAALLPGEGKIVVMATQLTLSMPKFHRLMESYGRDAILIPCPGLMECVEAGELSGPKVDAMLEEFLSPCKGLRVKAAVLGCTHYPFLKPVIARHFPPRVPLLDGSRGTARQLQRRLEACGLLNEGGHGSVRFFSSGMEADIRKMEAMLTLLRRQKENL